MFSDKFLKFMKIWEEEFKYTQTLEKNICVDKNGAPIPWYTYPAIEYLKQFDYSNKKVFEFGCGYSSRFWGKRAKSVISIENDESWLSKWEKEFTEKNIEIKLREQGPEYYNSILETEDIYDIIVVDGKNRTETAQTAIQRISPNGMIIFDDSDRVQTSEHYAKAGQTLKTLNFIQVDFHGFCPMSAYSKTTSIFLSRNIILKSIDENQPSAGTGNIWHLPKSQRKEFF